MAGIFIFELACPPPEVILLNRQQIFVSSDLAVHFMGKSR